MNHNGPDMNHNDLDEQIRAALQVERSPQQLARLECFWQRQSRVERRRRIRRVAALAATTLAATTLAAVALSVWLGRQEPARRPLEASRPRQIAPTRPDPNHADAPQPADAPQHAMVAQRPSGAKPLSAGRPPTTYERFLFAVHTRRSAAGKPPSPVAKIDEVIGQLTRDPQADAEQLAESSGLMQYDAQRRLLPQLLRSSDERKHAVLQLLAVCGTWRSVPHLLRLGRRETFRDEALATIERIVGLERLADVVGRATDQRVRAALFNRLLTADSEPALRGYLSLVQHDATRAEALAVADAVGQPLLASLLALLDDEDEAVRLSAALVLGHANGPEVTHALIARVTQQPSDRTETWIALLVCRGAQAEEFFAYATRQPRLLGQVNLARVRLTRMIP